PAHDALAPGRRRSLLVTATIQPNAPVPAPAKKRKPKRSFAERHPFLRGSFLVCFAAGLSGIAGWMAAMAGIKGAAGGVGVAVFITLMIVIKQREEVLLAVTVLSFGAILHKKFGAVHAVSSGPVAIYVNSTDVMTLVLYFV